jgi:drug/metabolite transporter (DMT)-like permease
MAINAESLAAPVGVRNKSRRLTPEYLDQAAPFIFVFIWSTGFVGARYGLPYAEPFTYLALRMVITTSMLAGLALIARWEWPSSLAQTGRIAVSGLLIHAVYLGGVFYAIDRGMPAGISALVVGLQPVLTALIASRSLREHINLWQWLGFGLGFGGVAIVVIERMRVNDGISSSSARSADVAILLALIAATLGAVYQKRYNADMPLASGTAIQYGATAIAVGLLAITTESMHIDWQPRFVFALTWQVVVLSLLGVSLYMVLIKRNSVSRLTSYFYLVPPLTALEAWLLFDERLSAGAIGGMALTAIGVALVVRRGARS